MLIAPDNLVSARSAAHLLKVPVEWLVGEAEAERLPGLLVGKVWRFSVPAVQKAMMARAEAMPAEVTEK